MKPKDFQQATANRILAVFRAGQHRILLSDEVGLGKTIIARDVIRQVSDWHRLEKNDDHFKVIYICSNINIANQNAHKLGIKNQMNISESRLSMQHLKIYQNKGRNHSYEQLIPLTPATSFSMTSGCGNQEERALMFTHLRRLPVFRSINSRLADFLAYDAKVYWHYFIDLYENKVIECDANGSNYIMEMSNLLNLKLKENQDLMDRIIVNLSSQSSSKRSESRPLINALRRIFAQISLEKLEPDLVIMDEFQRFRDLITPSDDEQGMLTKQFLQDTNTKVLLLSATPYKPYSTLEEISQDENTEHYQEFLEVMKFLFYDGTKYAGFQQIWKDYSNTLHEINNGNFTLLLAQKTTAEDALYQGICRTERFNSGIIDASSAKEISISTGDILSYLEMQNLLDEINKDSKRPLRYRNVPIDYMKSSPYLLSFMESYQLKKEIVEYFERTKKYEVVTGTKHLLIKKNAIHNYQPIAANNARLEELKEIVFANGKNGAENLLWLPPSKSYYTTGSVFDKNKNYSKLLVFSSWEMVPRMISLMISYEAERLTIGKLFHNAKTRRGRGYFATKEDRRYGITRLKNETEEILCYLSRTLARLYAPDQHIGQDIRQIRRELTRQLEPRIAEVKKKFQLSESSAAGAKAMLELLKVLDQDKYANPTTLPSNAVEILVNMAIGSPAICLFRLLDAREPLARDVTAKVFISLFNKAESSAVIDLLYGSKSDDTYYENVLKYCVDGNLQAMLDEYAHVLGETGDDLAKAIMDAFSDTTSLQVDTFESFTGSEKEKPRMRAHFAVGYFNSRISDENVQRTEKIRKAFNSPFRPFVLPTTSIGQEGLDFHSYCRKVMHWNLPSNPIDLEQREGRINRYKCLAVRQNITYRYGAEKTWDEMFAKAAAEEKGSHPDLVPFWCLTDPSNLAVKIERIVPMYPLSQDRLRYLRLIKILSLYRLTLGQPRQEELIELISREMAGEISDKIFMNLSPFYKTKL
jgi:hypothetical protein